MHAYASDDPVFLAMNKRGQRETNASLGIKTSMPLHGHGDSFAPTWTSNGDGTYTMKFHLFMPGLWQVTPTVTAESATDKAVYTFCMGG